MSKIRAKFKCESVLNYEHGKKASLRAVYGTSGENAAFAKATPNGTIEIGIDEDVVASEFFEPGKQYYVDFEKA